MLLALLVGSLTTLFYFWVEGYSSRINSLTALSTIGNPEVWTRARMFPMPTTLELKPFGFVQW
jgi:hypothetical protein